MVDKLSLASWAPASIVAAALFSLTWLILGHVSRGFTLFGTRISPYNWVAQPVSGLGLGETALLMNAVFVATAALLALGIAGTLASLPVMSQTEVTVVGSILLLSTVGFAMCGIFNLERILLHSIGYFIGVGLPVIGFGLLGWQLGRHDTYQAMSRLLMVAAVVTLILLVWYVRSFDPEASGQGLGISGLVQRLLVTEVLGMFSLLAWSVSGSAPQ